MSQPFENPFLTVVPEALQHQTIETIGMDIAGWHGQTADQLAQLADALPEASGFTIYAGDPELVSVAEEISQNGRAVILNDTEPAPKQELDAIWSEPSQLATRGIHFAIKSFNSTSSSLLPSSGLARYGISEITTLTPFEWQNFSGALDGIQHDPVKVARLMLATTGASNRDAVPRIYLPSGNDFWTKRLRSELIKQNDGLLYFSNTPSSSVTNALRNNHRQSVRAIVSPPGGAELATDPVVATISEAKRVARALKTIDLRTVVADKSSADVSKKSRSPRPMSADELRDTAEIEIEFAQKLST